MLPVECGHETNVLYNINERLNGNTLVMYVYFFCRGHKSCIARNQRRALTPLVAVLMQHLMTVIANKLSHQSMKRKVSFLICCNYVSCQKLKFMIKPTPFTLLLVHCLN